MKGHPSIPHGMCSEMWASNSSRDLKDLSQRSQKNGVFCEPAEPFKSRENLSLLFRKLGGGGGAE